jgi:acyl-CoA thioesterase-1
MPHVPRIFIALLAAAVFAFTVACSSADSIPGRAADLDRPLVEPKTGNSTRKIVAFGDSLTAGFGLTEKESYPYLLQERLRADGYQYAVINAGVSGDTSLGGVERADWVLNAEGVEVIVLELGANDLLRGVPAAQMKKNLDAIIRKAKAKNVKVLLCGMIAPPTMGTDYQRTFNTAFPDLAAEHKVAFVPFVLEGIALNKDLNQADGIHPNAAGARIMTETIYRELRKML